MIISVKKEFSKVKQSKRLALKREAEDAQVLKESKPEPTKGKRTAGDRSKLSDFLPDVKVPRLRDATSPQKVKLKLLSGRSMFYVH